MEETIVFNEETPNGGNPSVIGNTGNGNDVVDMNADSSKRRESTRSYIAQLYVWAFFVIIGVIILMWGGISLFTINSLEVEDLKDMLVTVSGILSGPLGFIVGYYFKASKE